MFYKIERNDGIFQSDLFLRDSMAFCIMEGVLNSPQEYPDSKVFSDGKDCVIVNSDPKHKIIVWTSDNFQDYGELYDFIKDEFYQNTPFSIMSKKSFYDYLADHKRIEDLEKYIKKNEYNGNGLMQRLGVFSCSLLKDIQYNGHPDQAKQEEAGQIAQMLVDCGKETKEDPNAVLQDYMEKAQEFVSNPMCLVWRNKDEKIVSTAKIRTNVKHPRVGSVYTLPDDRGKSYAKMLVHYLTSQVLKTGKTPMLFTDYDYEPSNRCYQGIGYKLNCTIVNFTPQK